MPLTGYISMSVTKDYALDKAGKLIALLKSTGMNIHEAYLFGSAVAGQGSEDSDIDLAIVSKEFTGLPFYDVIKISKYRRSIDLRLEIHPFSFDDIQANPPLFFLDIKTKGIEIN
jgi:predicted nucleotidyltransferase